MKKKIFISDNRFVYVGYGKRIKDDLLGDSILITECYNVRYYGTDKGLAQLAYEGKKAKTELDYCTPVTIPIGRIVATYDVLDEVKDTLC